MKKTILVKFYGRSSTARKAVLRNAIYAFPRLTQWV
jgi:hypothetical protein